MILPVGLLSILLPILGVRASPAASGSESAGPGASASGSASASSASASAGAGAGGNSSGYKGTGVALGAYTHGNFGACGTVPTDSDMIVAVAASVYDGYPGATENPNDNPICGKQISATYAGTTVTLTVADRCTEPCPEDGDLDMTSAAFKALTGGDDGTQRVGCIEWNFV
ncbi:DPBB-1 domain-containing protein [Mycena kentingensis (nom. inval.)]|nr:DPBB-1 domain-containing protein [Mycena kentingensis (nom. inval.)]